MSEGRSRTDELIGRLRQRGYRVTPQRAAVVRVLASSQDHPTVEQIYDGVRAEFPMTSLATVYKTLAVLKDMGEVLEVSIAGESTRYDGRRPECHPHLVCIRCKRIVDLEMEPMSPTCDEVAASTGYQVLHHRHDYFGICPDCQGTDQGEAAERQRSGSSQGDRGPSGRKGDR